MVCGSINMANLVGRTWLAVLISYQHSIPTLAMHSQGHALLLDIKLEHHGVSPENIMTGLFPTSLEELVGYITLDDVCMD